MSKVTNIVFAGLGGQGVITASDITAEAAAAAGYDVKKSEVHGMSQRGGSVTADIRFGKIVFSPLVPQGEADFLLAVDVTQVDLNRSYLAPGGLVIEPALIDDTKLSNKKSLNVALLGILSTRLPIPEPVWLETLRKHLPEKIIEANLQAWTLGRAAGTQRS